ncbi:MAG: hypothetical protein RIS88_33 [Pseudomonadota bacterium]|jgi:hypothetical protein
MILDTLHPLRLATRARTPRIVPPQPRPLALEARFMFDGAAAAVGVEVAPEAPQSASQTNAPDLSGLAFAFEVRPMEHGGRGGSNPGDPSGHAQAGLFTVKGTSSAITEMDFLDDRPRAQGNDIRVTFTWNGSTYSGSISGRVHRDGKVVAVYVNIDPETRNGDTPTGFFLAPEGVSFDDAAPYHVDESLAVSFGSGDGDISEPEPEPETEPETETETETTTVYGDIPGDDTGSIVPTGGLTSGLLRASGNPTQSPSPPTSELPQATDPPASGSPLGSAAPGTVLTGSAAPPLPPPPSAAPFVPDAPPSFQARQIFDSTLFPHRAGFLVEPNHLIEPPAAQHHPLQRTLALWALNETYTEAPDDGWRVVVHPDTANALSVFRGMPDQFIESDGVAYISVPWDSFFHTRSEVRVTVYASLADGTPLPSWIQLNPETGVFQLLPPSGFLGELAIRLQARDGQGREATTLFRLHVGERAPTPSRGDGAPGRSALSAQLRDEARHREGAFASRVPQEALRTVLPSA